MGFEPYLVKELTLKGFEYPTRIMRGGVEIDAPLRIVFDLNSKLKLATRILLRLGSFKARDLPTLHKKILKVSFRDFIGDIPEEIKISTNESRLIHTKKIEVSLRKSLKEYLRRNPPSKYASSKKASSIYVRIDNDIATISVDSSGEILHKRYGSEKRSKAAIRENFASLIPLVLHDYQLKLDNIIDPMCGSATLLIEYLEFNTPSNRLNFSCLAWPILKNLKISQEPAKRLNIAFHGLDIESEIIDYNLSTSWSEKISFKHSDLFSKSEGLAGENLVISNIPYEKRVTIQNGQLHDIINKVVEKYAPKAIALIHARSQKLKTHRNYKLQESIKFNNNGIMVELSLYLKRS